MPFTPSHPAAVLLLGRSGLPVAAMVAGSMAADLPMFVPVPGLYAAAPSWAWSRWSWDWSCWPRPGSCSPTEPLDDRPHRV